MPPVPSLLTCTSLSSAKKATEKETLFVGRVLVLSLIAFAIANSKGSGAQAIMDMVENAWGAFGASFGPTILLSLFWKRFNYQGAVADVISGFVIDLGWLLTGMTASTGIFEIVPGFFGSLVVAIIVAKLTSAPNEKRLPFLNRAPAQTLTEFTDSRMPFGILESFFY